MAAKARSYPLVLTLPPFDIAAPARDQHLLPQVQVKKPASFPGLRFSPAQLIALLYQSSSSGGAIGPFPSWREKKRKGERKLEASCLLISLFNPVTHPQP